MVDMEQFERLSILSQQFNQQGDALNSAIEEWNKRLLALSLGQVVWLTESPLTSDEYYGQDDNSEEYRRVKFSDEVYLGYAKVDGHWQLAVKKESYTLEKNFHGYDVWISDREQQTITRLLSTDRETRTLAAGKLGTLFRALEKHVMKGLETQAEALKLAEADKS